MFKQLLCLIFIYFIFTNENFAQPCSLLGMTPSTAIPVCGTAVFHQDIVVNCSAPSVAHTGCSDDVTSNNSFWYKFTCYSSGTLGFLINGISDVDDYDWELFDVTGHDINDVYTDPSLQISLNIYGVAPGAAAPFPNSPTGCSASGIGRVHCSGAAASNSPFNQMPNIILGHNYLLMVTNWSASTSGYNLSFSGGSSSITDPLDPHLLSSTASCDGTQATIKINKRMKCSSLTSNGSEFFITPNLANVIGSTGYGCTTGFDMDSLMLTLDKPLPPGGYTITIKKGTDGNTIEDNCDKFIIEGENIPMIIYPLIPTPMDSLTKVLCAPDVLQLIFKKNIRCSSIAADGSDFKVNGSSSINVISANGICNTDGLTTTINVQLSKPISIKGNFTILLKIGNDGNTILDECGQSTPAGSSLNFTTKDTVNADFSYHVTLDCTKDLIIFLHNGNNEVNSWKWNFDNQRSSIIPNPSMSYAVPGNKQVQLIVSNGICKDTSEVVNIFLDNYLKASFEGTQIVCPGDLGNFIDSSVGNIIQWKWIFSNGNISYLKQPPLQTYPINNSVIDVPIYLIVTNSLGCSDTAKNYIKVVGNCYIAVPNAFTPNGDGLNDYLFPLNAYIAKDLSFKVYNRFGQTIFFTTDWTKKWDGTFKGQPADAGTYVWILHYTNTDTGKIIEQKGTSILIR